MPPSDAGAQQTGRRHLFSGLTNLVQSCKGHLCRSPAPTCTFATSAGSGSQTSPPYKILSGKDHSSFGSGGDTIPTVAASGRQYSTLPGGASKPSSSMIGWSPRMKELFSKYGWVAIGIHLTINYLSVAALFFAIRNNVDVPGVLAKFGIDLSGHGAHEAEVNADGTLVEVAAGDATSGAVAVTTTLGLAFLCNKPLIVLRAPLTFLLTPPAARFLRKHRLMR